MENTTTTTTKQLNEVSALLQSHDPNGKAPTKATVFSVCIQFHINNGKTVREAIDAVLGAGAFEGIAESVYNTLNGPFKA